MVVTTIGQILALGGLIVVALLLHRITRIEFTLSCLAVGLAAGLSLEWVAFDTGIRAHNLQDLVFFVLLPVLIFEAAWHLKPALLRRWLMPILILSIAGVLISALVTAALVYWGIGHAQGFPWMAALLTGAILAATDPVAVMAQLRSLNAPEDLSTLFEGESLFNDAAAVVLFTIVVGLATGADAGESSYLGFFGMVFAGGVVFGLLMGLVTGIVVLFTGDPPASRLILVVSALGSFYLAEHVLHVSGIMAVIAAAMVTRISLREVEDTVADGVDSTWEWLGLLCNSLLFVIMGLTIVPSMFEEQWLAMLIAIAAVLVARIAAVGLSCGLSGLLGRPISFAWQLLLVWGGLRGAIAIALVLSLPTSLPYWWTIQSMVFGVVLFSLLVQGGTNSMLVRKFG
jgi:CPA1 family monovalent cation:H+ antiporter